MTPDTTQYAPTQAGAGNAPPVEEDFDAILSEALAAKEGPATVGPDLNEPTAPGEDAAKAPAPPEDGAAIDHTAGNAPPVGQTSHDDIWASANPALRAAHETAIRDEKLRAEGAKGRQSALQREVNELRKKLDRLQAGNDRPAESTDGHAHTGATTDDATIRSLREEYPDIAGPMLDRIDSLTAKIGELEKPLGQMQEQMTTSALVEQQNALTAKHPDWLSVAQDDRFHGWIETQSQMVKSAMDRNRDAIVDVEDAALVIGLFKQAMGIGAVPQQQQPATPTHAPAVQDKRQRQIAAGRDAGRTGPPVATGLPDDFDAALDIVLRNR